MTDLAFRSFSQDNLVSSRPEDGAQLLDPAFINAWGIALRPAGLGGHWWVTNTDTSRVTLYVGDSASRPFTQDGLSVLGVPGAPDGTPTNVTIDPPSQGGVPLPPPTPTPASVLPPSNPTGQVFSGSATDFLVSGTSLTGTTLTDAPARFITVSEDGTIAAWGEAGATAAQRMDAFAVVVNNSDGGAIYKGVAVSADSGSGNRLFAANFSQARIDVFDAAWQPVATAGFEPRLPTGGDAAGYAPFNIERVFDASLGADVLIATYARVADAAAGEEESIGGFIVKYALDGGFLGASDAGGLFNAPWGVALAPAEYGAFGGALLVGNFGDGHIVGLDLATLAPEGLLLDGRGRPVMIDGLWDLAFGNGESLGRADRLYFAAGPEEESEGLFGSLGLRSDVAVGGAGDDALTATGDAIALLGQGGGDTLDGAAGQDTLHGGAGTDRLDGGGGRDRLKGGAGADLLTGGAGADRFVFRALDGVTDRILDFDGAAGDRIVLRGIDADASTAADDAFAFIGDAAFSAAGQLRIEQSGVGWLVQASVGAEFDAALSIEVASTAALSARDFVL